MQISLNNSQATLTVDEPLLVSAAAAILDEAGVQEGSLSIAVVDDQQIHTLNRQFLAHDYPTDVLSFALEEREGYLEGEVIVSADTAATNAVEYRHAPHQELLLYVIHGVLHLVGYRDKADADQAEMRAAERRYLDRFTAGAASCSSGGEPQT